ncbi:hypothetical protein DFH06DRAFT_1128171 [Mycena polygramma]|nr:hypothetical protein DFH06DRAFT_1128171 [Mycena polygramma]
MSSDPLQHERRERSRNAKAQARHRAKRKAYVEKLEESVTKLQLASAFTAEEIAVLPSPLIKIRDLETENLRLLKENSDLRRLLSTTGERLIQYDVGRGNSLTSSDEARQCVREYKRRKVQDDSRIGQESSFGTSSRLPPLIMPQSTISRQQNPVASSYDSYDTFSRLSPLMIQSTQSRQLTALPFDHSGSQSYNSTITSNDSSHFRIPKYHQYMPVKGEYEYASSDHSQPVQGHYSLSPYSQTIQNDSWRAYSSERVAWGAI